VTPPPPPAGWYPNPDGTASLRWWDGGRWTEHVHATPAPPAPDAIPVPPPLPSASPPGVMAPPGPIPPPPERFGGPRSAAPVAGRTGLVVAICFVVVAAVVFVPSVFFVARTVVDQIVHAPTMAVPGTLSLSLPASGDYYLYDPLGVGALDASDLVVVGPNGTAPTLGAPTGTQTVTRDGRTYTASVGFHAAVAGDYTITVRASSAGAHRVIVAPSFGTVAAEVAGWGVGIGLSVLLGIAGIVILVVALVQRSRARRAMPPSYPTPLPS